MKSILSRAGRGRPVASLAALALLSLATGALASRVHGGAAPAASAVRSSAQEPAHLQADESASLRQGTIAALDARGGRAQVQGIWLDLVPGKTQLLRSGQPACLGTLRVGEAIRFTVAPGRTGAPALKVIYAP
jgi:hypothetical protein